MFVRKKKNPSGVVSIQIIDKEIPFNAGISDTNTMSNKKIKESATVSKMEMGIEKYPNADK
jgi:hypothetical protein